MQRIERNLYYQLRREIGVITKSLNIGNVFIGWNIIDLFLKWLLLYHSRKINIVSVSIRFGRIAAENSLFQTYIWIIKHAKYVMFKW